MTQETLLKTGSDSAAPKEISPHQAHSTTLRENVRQYLKQYLIQLDNMRPVSLYEFILSEIEPPMLEATLQYTGQNQSEAARLLGLSRGTLRKKMQLYGLLK